jgi:hypothetical protein
MKTILTITPPMQGEFCKWNYENIEFKNIELTNNAILAFVKLMDKSISKLTVLKILLLQTSLSSTCTQHIHYCNQNGHYQINYSIIDCLSLSLVCFPPKSSPPHKVHCALETVLAALIEAAH